MDVRQGNYLTPETIAKIKPGMDKSAVIEILGTPALDRFFEKDRIDYYYYLKPGNNDNVQEKRLSILFKGDKVVQIIKDRQ